MNPDLEAILAADEEARARVAAAERDAAAALERLRGELAASRKETLRRLESELEAEVAGILSEGERVVEERRRRRAAWIARKREEGESLLATAAERYESILEHGREGP